MDEVNVSGKLNRRKYVASKDQLDRDAPTQGLKEITVKPVRPTEGEARVAANVTLRWPGEGDESDEEYPIENLNEGETVRVREGLYVKLEKRRAGLPWWLLLLIVLAVLIWLAVFGYLYFRA
jgi:hypothetical protein